jgi:hypothetical protein
MYLLTWVSFGLIGYVPSPLYYNIKELRYRRKFYNIELRQSYYHKHKVYIKSKELLLILEQLRRMLQSTVQ